MRTCLARRPREIIAWSPIVVGGPVIEPKRIAPRLRTTLTVRLPDGWQGEVVDLSAAGMRVRTMAVIPLETVIDVKIEHGGRLVPARMTVVWAEPPSFDVGELGEIGLELAEVSDTYLQLAAELFAND